MRRTSSALLRGSAAGGAVAGLAVVTLCAFWGWRAVLAAVVGSLVAGTALAVGPILLRTSAAASPLTVTALGTGGYLVVVLALGGVFALLAPATWLSPGHLVLALLAVTVGSVAGQVRAFARLRVPVFDAAGDGPDADRPRLPAERGPRWRRHVRGGNRESSAQAGR